ncbi:Uma2 family endonuclease [Thermoleptolyngbya sp. C42_A2020_037]|uniref:Uma2 family endonuclease n=1 Tax=Thermoleptolyngbya sp. C42_A2020_037 TaxID=2747799 RepID=UPI0025D260FF|nr:Uma2 family endonuclease [Thermoleptolyngbya sp. C42_A2020_037]
MTIANPVVKPISQLELAPGSMATLRNVTWQEFESILEELGEQRAARVAYSGGNLEIMVPLPEHERAKIVIADLVKTILRSQRRNWEPLGSTTFKREETSRPSHRRNHSKRSGAGDANRHQPVSQRI